ncbi:LOW QUALITY PROTEIN: acid phosphatase type 7-like [Megaptera novaeangliae]
MGCPRPAGPVEPGAPAVWGGRHLEKAGSSGARIAVGGGMSQRLQTHKIPLSHWCPETRMLAVGAPEVYRCGSTQGRSRRFLYRALKIGPHWSPCLAVFGDTGADNPRALPRLCRDTQQGRYDVVLHVGDFACSMDQEARVRDKFMNLTEPVAASLPYVTCPGNHEACYNFSNYKARFSMPGNSEGLWYSWDLGPAHSISFSTEVYFFLHYDHLVERQFCWLEGDLQKANKNRTAPPWIITMGHRPMYCSSADLDDCIWHESKVRKGLLGKFYGLEDLFYKYASQTPPLPRSGFAQPPARGTSQPSAPERTDCPERGSRGSLGGTVPGEPPDCLSEQGGEGDPSPPPPPSRPPGERRDR